MTDPTPCQRCGATRPVAASSCPRCLLALGLSSAAGPDEGDSEPPGDVGGFRILDTLGETDVSVVYLARSPAPERRRVALKVVRAGKDPGDALDRLHAQGDALAQVSHPGIAGILESGTAEDGRPFFASQWVPGVPITEHCDRERLTVDQRLEMLVEVCEAVEHAHAAGVVHGGIKASNVVVTEEKGRRQPTVLDLGVSGALGHPLRPGARDSAQGLLSGDLYHLAPEQTRVEAVGGDPRSDVYGLGVLLYELLAGMPPFDPRRLRQASRDGVVEIVQRHEPIRPSARVAGLAGTAASEVAVRRRTAARDLTRTLRGDLDSIVLKAMAKEPAMRYSSAYELGLDLRRHLRGEPVTAGSAELIVRLRRAAGQHPMALALLSILLVGLIAWTLSR